MNRSLGSWLSGPSAAREPGDGTGQSATTSGDGHGRPLPGVRLGLPADGPGSVASTGSRAAALCVDIVLSALVAGLFTAPHLPRNWSLVVLCAEYVVFLALFGQTPGMRLLGVRTERLGRPGHPVGLPAAVVRTVLLVLLVPALIRDADGRGLHDRLTSTVVIRG